MSSARFSAVDPTRFPVGRVAGALFLVGSAVSAVALASDVLSPGPRWLHASVVACALVAGLVLTLMPRRPTSAMVHAAGVLATVLTSVSVAAGGWQAYVPFYGWIVLFFAIVASLRGFLAQLGLAGAGLVTALVAADADRTSLLLSLWWLNAVVVTALLVYGSRLHFSRRLESKLHRLTDDLQEEHRIRVRDNERYQTLVEALPLVVYIDELDDSASTRFISPQVEALLGYSPEEWKADGDLWVKLLHPDDRPHATWATRVHNETGRPFRAEYRLRAKDGRWVWFRDEASMAFDGAGMPFESRGYMLDITEQKQLEEQLSFQAFHDPLTGLANRALFRDRLSHALARRDAAPVFVIYADLDDFKSVNDGLGHDAGDAVLVSTAARLAAIVRRGDTVARLGGDEFAVLVENESTEGAAVLAGRIAQALAEPIEIDGFNLLVSASVGVASGADGAEIDHVIQNADLAMYSAKQRGKGLVEVYTDVLSSRSSDRLALRTDLRRAIAAGELELFLQPIVELSSRRIVGAEGLARWFDPQRGPVSPAEFVPLAEEAGLVVALTRWALRSAAAAAAVLVPEHGPRFFVTVNLSARDLLEDDLGPAIRRVLGEHGLEPRNLLVELTETALLAEPELAAARMAELRDVGVRVAIDDFGIGYSSLSDLGRLPVDVLKVARPFVEAIGSGSRDERLVGTVVSMGRDLGLSVIAEGVETSAQALRLLETGCDLGQGFLFGFPAGLGDFPAAGGARRAVKRRPPPREIPRAAAAG